MTLHYPIFHTLPPGFLYWWRGVLKYYGRGRADPVADARTLARLPAIGREVYEDVYREAVR